MNNMLTILDSPGLLKDKNTGAVLCSDAQALARYRAQKQEKSQINTIMNDINKLRQDIDMLKNCIWELISQRTD